MAGRNEPFETFNFRVQIAGMPDIGFKEVSGIESRIEVVEYREGEQRAFSARKLPGKVTYSNIILKTGITNDKSLFDWHMQWVTKDIDAKRKEMRIVLLNGGGDAVLSWHVREAWPVAYFGPSFNAESSVVAIQTFEIAHEGFNLE